MGKNKKKEKKEKKDKKKKSKNEDKGKSTLNSLKLTSRGQELKIINL